MTNPCVKTPRMPDPLLSELSYRLDSSGRMCRCQAWKASRRRRRTLHGSGQIEAPGEGVMKDSGSVVSGDAVPSVIAVVGCDVGGTPTLLEETRRLRRPRGRVGPGDRRCRLWWRRLRRCPIGAAALRQSISHSPGSAVIRASKQS